MIIYDDIVNFHCPRWNELPDIDLYMDQVVSIIEKHFSLFSGDKNKIITAAMVNNYVKQKVVKPPKNKKYDRVHLAYLIPVCIFKQIMGIQDICKCISFLLSDYDLPQAYDAFCSLLEEGLKNAFICCETTYISDKDTTNMRLVKSIIISFSNLQYSKYLLENTDILNCNDE